MATGTEARTEGVGDQHHIGLFADRTLLAGLVADVLSSPYEFRVGIADVQERKATVPKVAYDGVARQAIVDVAQPVGARRCTADHSGLQGHDSQGNRPEGQRRRRMLAER